MSRPAVQQFAGHYRNLGFQVVPLKPREKVVAPPDWMRIAFTVDDFADDDNIGIRSVNGLIVLDLDASEAVSVADAFMPRTGAVFGRPSKPRAKRLYFCEAITRTRVFKDDRGKTLVELRANHQDMAPPSVHPDGERLKWDGLLLDPAAVDGPTLERAAQLVATAAIVARHYPPPGARHEWSLALAGTLKGVGLTEEECRRVVAEASRIVGDAKASDRDSEIRSTYSRSDADATTGAGKLRDISGRAVVTALQRIWNVGLDFRRTQNGAIVQNSQQNIRIALDRLNVELTHDDFSHRPFISWNGRAQYLGDDAAADLWLAIEEQCGFLPTRHIFDAVIRKLAREHSYHPVRDYLSGLRWDHTPRLHSWLSRYGQAADSPYTRAVGALVLIAAVRRVRQPGCKFDEMLVLESSQQGLLKSTALRTLCPRSEWFSDDLPLNVDAKQVIERTAGKWIIEAADLSGMRRTQAEHLKAMLSRQVDGPVRLAYAHLPDEVPRQFIIIGTTNSRKYLKDSTGNRRFWPVSVDKFDVEALRRDRDHIWAEAAYREAAGESIRLDPALYSFAETQQDSRRLEDPWEPSLRALFEDGTREYRFTNDVLFEHLGIPVAQRGETESARIAAVMEAAGFEHKKARSIGNSDGKTVKRWCRAAVHAAVLLE